MALPLQKFREIVFQLLYSYNMGRAGDEDMIELLSKELKVTKTVVRSAHNKVVLIQRQQDAIDLAIGQASQSYTFERIQTVECNILRLAVYEMLYDNEIPHKVAIAEAMRLARKFGTPEAALFINAVLETIYKTSHGDLPNPEGLKKSVEELQESEDIAHEASQTLPDQSK